MSRDGAGRPIAAAPVAHAREQRAVCSAASGGTPERFDGERFDGERFGQGGARGRRSPGGRGSVSPPVGG